MAVVLPNILCSTEESKPHEFLKHKDHQTSKKIKKLKHGLINC